MNKSYKFNSNLLFKFINEDYNKSNKKGKFQYKKFNLDKNSRYGNKFKLNKYSNNNKFNLNRYSDKENLKKNNFKFRHNSSNKNPYLKNNKFKKLNKKNKKFIGKDDFGLFQKRQYKKFFVVRTDFVNKIKGGSDLFVFRQINHIFFILFFSYFLGLRLISSYD